MNKEETLALYAEGRDKWNAWAKDILLWQDMLHADMEAKAVAAKAYFGDYMFEEEAAFAEFIFPGDAIFAQAVFLKNAWFGKAIFCGEAGFQD